jgi:SAM-dependent methyltransferase
MPKVSFPRRIARRLLSYRQRAALRRLPRALWLLGRRYQCNCCRWRFRRLLPFKNRANRQCPWCGSIERHRLLALYLHERTSALERPTDVLHVAPEEGLRRVLRRSRTARTVSVDLEHPLADLHMDIRGLTFADETFDLAICSHVLEHVPEDHRAIAELYRVLRPGGTLLVMVPWDESAAKTREDLRVVDPAERLRLYGQSTHVRMYGRDLVERLGVAGFDVETDRFGAELPADVAQRHVIAPLPIFRCSKPPRQPQGRD